MHWIHHTCHLVNRDYFGCVNLCAHLKQRGIPIVLGGTKVEGQSTQSYWDLCLAYKPSLVILPKTIDAPRFRDFIAKRDSTYEPFCLVIPTEFGEYSRDPQARLKKLMDDKGKRNGEGANAIFAISEAERQSILSLYAGITPEMVKVTGNPRYDIFHDSFSFFRPSKESIAQRLGIAPDTPLITLFTAYTQADLHNNYDSPAYKKISHHWATSSVWEESRIKAFVGAMWHMREATIKLAEGLAKAYPKACFVIKTHPDESLDYYAAQLGKISNVRVTRNFLSSDLLPYSALHVHHFCTTALEAYAAGAPWVHFQLPSVEDIEHKLKIKDASPQCADPDDIIEMAGQALSGNDVVEPSIRQQMSELHGMAFDDHVGKSGDACAQQIRELLPRCAKGNAEDFEQCQSFLMNYHKHGFFGQPGKKPSWVKQARFTLSKALGRNHFPFLYHSTRFPTLDTDIKRVAGHIE